MPVSTECQTSLPIYNKDVSAKMGDTFKEKTKVMMLVVENALQRCFSVLEACQTSDN